jgi:dihydrofolate synthase/folylpolyglutamate synthase
MTNLDVDSLLKPYQRFGVHLGLERIQRLLANLGNPQQQVPVIHVAGTNGKGSVCAYLSAVLKAAGYRVGRYTSPHLVDWKERICLNDRPIESDTLQQILLQVQQAIRPDEETPTQFELITAAAWLYFAQVRVDIAVIEVGLGGRLDATNVCDRPLVTVITSISREHWQQLGPTVADIAREKAGILKSNCPAVIGQLPPEAETVVRSRIEELGCPAVFPLPARQIEPGWAEFQNQNSKVKSQKIRTPDSLKYPLPLLGDIQLMNSALAVAALQILQQQGWKISEEAIANGMGKASWLGRLQWTTWQDRQLLIDGAHNPAAAEALRHYVDRLGKKPVSWVMGMLSTKDHADIFRALLRPQDELHLVPVPDHSTADPEALAKLAREVCPQLSACYTYSDLFAALEAATKSSNLIILCGSLYLVGYFLRIAG